MANRSSIPLPRGKLVTSATSPSHSALSVEPTDRNHQSNLPAMNNFKWHGHLLDTILAIRAGVGDGLNDHELTQLLRDGTLLSEAGFSFLSFSEGIVTLTVPEQDLATWYPEHGWIAPEKEKLARALA